MKKKDMMRELIRHRDCPCGNHNVNGEDVGCIDYLIDLWGKGDPK